MNDKPLITVLPGRSRIASIDLLRGLIMVIMALDHVRDYFHADAFLHDPTNLDETSPALFFTRWITHFCAPVFIFLAGTSAFFIGNKTGNKKALSLFLLKRGIWLIILELTLLKFLWNFTLNYSSTMIQVIWALGAGMIALAALIHLPRVLLLITGIALVALHNLTDGFASTGNSAGDLAWSLLHVQRGFRFSEGFRIFIAYPILPWIGVMVLGYCFGSLYKTGYNAARRIGNLYIMGGSLILLFVLLRFSNIYGDPEPWSGQPSAIYTLLSFLNTDKYPPSLLYLCMTIGPALVLLALFEKSSGWIAEKLVVIGRVPMFYYIMHVLLIHTVAAIAAEVTGYGWRAMISDTWINGNDALRGYGFRLGAVYGFWVLIVLLLYPLCSRYNRYKNEHRNYWWLGYL